MENRDEWRSTETHTGTIITSHLCQGHGEWVGVPLGKSADDMKVSGVVYGLRQGMASRGFWMGWVDGLGRWAGVKLGKASGVECMILSVDQTNLGKGYWIGDV